MTGRASSQFPTVNALQGSFGGGASDVFVARIDTVTFTVTETDDTAGTCGADCSLREAVINSNVCAGTQTIDIPAGIYDLSIVGTGEDAAATGDLDITDDAILMGLGAPFIDANGIDRVFEIHSTATVEMHSMLIRGGEAQQGAGVRNYGNLTMVGGVVTNNTGVMGDFFHNAR